MPFQLMFVFILAAGWIHSKFPCLGIARFPEPSQPSQPLCLAPCCFFLLVMAVF